MESARRIWQWGSGLVIGLLVVTYVATLLVHNTCKLVGEGSRIDRAGDHVLSATGTTQRWNMFAPNVGTLSYSPVVVLVFRDGRRVALHSEVEPDLPGWHETYPIPNSLEGDARNYSWRFHVGDGRIRKLESRAASYADNWWRVRTTYARWRAAKWLQQHPHERRKLQRIELWRCKIRHPGYGNTLHCEAVEVLPIRPHADAHQWPISIDPRYPPYWS